MEENILDGFAQDERKKADDPEEKKKKVARQMESQFKFFSQRRPMLPP